MPIVKWYTVGDSGGEKSNFKYTDELNETEHFFCFAHNASAATVSCGYWYSRHRTVWFAYEFGLLTFECLLLFYSKAPVCAQTKRQHDQVFWGACAAIESSVHKLYLYLCALYIEVKRYLCGYLDFYVCARSSFIHEMGFCTFALICIFAVVVVVVCHLWLLSRCVYTTTSPVKAALFPLWNAINSLGFRLKRRSNAI